jgi:hypothetical protein
VFVEKGVAGAFRATGHRGSTLGGPAKVPGGVGKSGVHWRRRITEAESLTGDGLDSNSGTARLGGRSRGLGQLPDGEVERAWEVPGSVARRSARTTVRPR